MPALSTPLSVSTNVSFSIVDKAGFISRTGANIDAPLSDAQYGALRDAIGNATNGAMIGTTRAIETVDNINTRVVFDEAYASVGNKLVLVYQNAARRTRRAEVPAPDASLFDASGRTVDPANAEAAALIAAFKAAFDASTEGPFTLTRGYLISKTRRPAQAPLLVSGTLREPAVGELPPPAPGA